MVAAVPPDPISTGPVEVQSYSGPREELRGLFELAEDSPIQLDSYLRAGRVLVAVAGTQVIGHLQLVDTVAARALRDQEHGGAARTCGAAGSAPFSSEPRSTCLAAESATSLAVATAAADVGNLRFYQRQGFRMRSVERDAFGPATGYPPEIVVDGIELRDRVGLDRAVPASSRGDSDDSALESGDVAMQCQAVTTVRRPSAAPTRITVQ